MEGRAREVPGDAEQPTSNHKGEKTAQELTERLEAALEHWFPCFAGERLIVDPDGWANWGRDDWPGF